MNDIANETQGLAKPQYSKTQSIWTQGESIINHWRKDFHEARAVFNGALWTRESDTAHTALWTLLVELPSALPVRTGDLLTTRKKEKQP